jgi:hypothetical protein
MSSDGKYLVSIMQANELMYWYWEKGKLLASVSLKKDVIVNQIGFYASDVTNILVLDDRSLVNYRYFEGNMQIESNVYNLKPVSII